MLSGQTVKEGGLAKQPLMYLLAASVSGALYEEDEIACERTSEYLSGTFGESLSDACEAAVVLD